MQKPLDSDDDLIQACRDGNPHAWELLIDRYERLVYSIPLSYDLSREDAADVTQVTFTSLLQSLDMLREDSRLSAWLATVARRQTWQLLARARREDHEEYTELIGAVATLRGDATDALERWEMLQWLHEGLDQLAGRCRRCWRSISNRPICRMPKLRIGWAYRLGASGQPARAAWGGYGIFCGRPSSTDLQATNRSVS
jgi:RNA polymerase sigma factor (sigma-70 family)